MRVELEQEDRTRGAVTGPTTAPLALARATAVGNGVGRTRAVAVAADDGAGGNREESAGKTERSRPASRNNGLVHVPERLLPYYAAGSPA